MTREEAIADFKEEVYKFKRYLEVKKINPLPPSDDEDYKEYIHFCHEIEKDIERDEIAISALSADVRPNIHATWEKVSADKYIQSGNYRYRCSMCGELTIGEPNFCPTCGADMRGEANE